MRQESHGSLRNSAGASQAGNVACTRIQCIISTTVSTLRTAIWCHKKFGWILQSSLHCSLVSGVTASVPSSAVAAESISSNLLGSPAQGTPCARTSSDKPGVSGSSATATHQRVILCSHLSQFTIYFLAALFLFALHCRSAQVISCLAARCCASLGLGVLFYVTNHHCTQLAELLQQRRIYIYI